MTRNIKDVAGGALLLMFALAFGIGSLNNELGTSLNMGPGYFPLIVSALLALVGMGILIGGLGADPDPIGPVPLRGLILVLIAPIAFLVAIDPLGLVPALFITGLLCALASNGISFVRAVVTSVAITAFSYVVFVIGLGASTPAFGHLLGFG